MASPSHKKLRSNEKEDRISSLPNELIHHILSFLDAQLAVQTSVLSRRWKFIWTTLPFLNFDEMNRNLPDKVFPKFIRKVISRRKLDSNIYKMKLRVKTGFPADDLNNHVKYAISHGVQDLNVDTCNCELSIFKSNSLKQLELAMNFESAMDFHLGSMLLKDCWDLPALTSLYLVHANKDICSHRIPESCFSCLPALKFLHIESFSLPTSFCSPALATLYLRSCKFPETLWDLPSLISLELEDVDIPLDISDFFSALVSLQNLTMWCCFEPVKDCLISCPQLLYLELKTIMGTASTLSPNIVILSPKLRSITTVGIFIITRGLFKLENANVKLHGGIDDKFATPWGMLKQYYYRLILMFAGLGSTKILTLDLDTIEALSVVHDLVECSSSPFNNLKYVKIPHGYKESSLSGTLKSYLLSDSPGATIVTRLPQNDVIPQIASVPQNVVLEESLETPTTELADSQGIHEKVCTDTLGKRVQEEHVVKNSGLVDGKVRQVSPDPMQGLGGLLPIAPGGEGNDWKLSSRGNSDFGLWQGHEVNSEFVGLLDLILEKYPETFEHFNTTSKKLCTIKLNLLCTLVNAFTETTMTDNEILSEYRTLFTSLQRSFNLEWLVSCLNNIEQLQFSQHEIHAINSCIGDAKNKLQVWPTVGAEKLAKKQEAFETMGTNYAAREAFETMGSNHAATEAYGTMGSNHAARAGYIGDDRCLVLNSDSQVLRN